jgi:hypothetical protein
MSSIADDSVWIGAAERPCRFYFPRPVSNSTRLRQGTDKNVGASEFMVLQRTEADVNTVPHVPAALQRWEANTNCSLVSSVHGTASYVCSYMTKAETEGIRQAVHEGLATLPEGSSMYRKFHKIGTRVLGQREYSMQVSCCFGGTLQIAILSLYVRQTHMWCWNLSGTLLQEATFLLGGMDLRGGSRAYVRISVGFPQNRVRIAKPGVLRSQNDDDAVGTCNNVYDYYAHRPASLEGISLFAFASEYDFGDATTRRSGVPQGAEVRLLFTAHDDTLFNIQAGL